MVLFPSGSTRFLAVVRSASLIALPSSLVRSYRSVPRVERRLAAASVPGGPERRRHDWLHRRRRALGTHPPACWSSRSAWASVWRATVVG